MAQKEVKQRISSVKNVQKITRAMEMVAAARLRRAEQRIEDLRPYASAIRRMTKQAAEAAQNVPNIPVLQDRDDPKVVGIVVMTGDRGLAGAFNSQIIRAAVRGAVEEVNPKVMREQLGMKNDVPGQGRHRAPPAGSPA